MFWEQPFQWTALECLFHYLVLTSQWERLFLKRCVVLCRIKHEFIYHCAGVLFRSYIHFFRGYSLTIVLKQAEVDTKVSILLGTNKRRYQWLKVLL